MYGNELSDISSGFSLPVKVKNQRFSPEITEEFFAEHGQPIPCDKGYGESIYNDLLIAYSSKKDYDYIPRSTWPYYVRCEVYRFWMAFIAYYESSNPVIPPLKLLSLIKLEEEGIIWLKKVRSFAMVTAMNGWFQDTDPEDLPFYEESKKYRLVDLGDFFNVRYFLFFDQEDPHMEENLWTPLNVEPEMYDRFKNACYQIIPKINLDVIQEEEILLDITASNSLLGDKSVPLWYSKQKENYFSDKPLYGKASYIQKCPGDTRFSLTLSAPHSNSVKLVEKQIALLAQEVPWSNYVKDNDEFYKRFYRIHRYL